MKILNLYAGIGGNRKLWGTEHDITAVELDPKIAEIYSDFFPGDKMIIADAHQYLLGHFKEFDFIWSSPPCPTHSKLNSFMNANGINHYPDMKLYEEIIFLKHWYYGKYCIENVIAYYDPLIKPNELNSHYYWTNFFISQMKNNSRKIITSAEGGGTIKERAEKLGFNINKEKFCINNEKLKKILNNCVEPETGLHILNESVIDYQKELFR